MTEKLQVELIEQEMRLSKILNPTQFIKKGSMLKKLPMWGEQVDADSIDFLWPTNEIMESI